jgi:general secretion pathway protein C
MRSRPLSAIRSLGWPSWLATLALFMLLCAIAAYWALVLFAPRSPIAPAGASAERAALPELQLASQLFGATPGMVTAAAASNIQVIGIVAAGRRGSAILAVDGKPAKSFAVGEQLSSSQRLAEVRTDAVVVVGVGAPIELPVPESASMAVLTSGADQPQRPAGTSAAPLPNAGLTALTPPPAAPQMPAAPPAGAAPAELAKPDQDGAAGTPGVVHGIVPVQPPAPGQ